MSGATAASGARAAALVESARFADVLDLARLPYFEARDGDRLVLADRSLGPAIDVHTHLAQSFVRRRSVDLFAATPRTLHYLPVRGRALDLDVYQNQCFSADDLARMRRDLTLGCILGGRMRATHTIPNLLREMEDLSIVKSVLLPIDWPFASSNARDWLAAIARAGAAEAAARPGFVGFGSVHPYRAGVARELDRQIALGARGVKVHPAYQVVPPNDRRAMRFYRLCAARRLPVLFHCGPVGIEPWLARRLSQVEAYRPAVAGNPDVTFVLGHSGALQMERALELARAFPNVWLELSGQSLSNVGRILAEADPDRVVFGTDWPWYHQAIGLAKVFLATEGRPDLRRKVLYENAARLLRIDPPAAPAARPGCLGAPPPL